MIFRSVDRWIALAFALAAPACLDLEYEEIVLDEVDIVSAESTVRPGTDSFVNPALARRFSSLPERFDRPGHSPSKAVIDLGRMLYFEPRISASQRISCDSCHMLSDYGDDGIFMSIGHRGEMGTRNAPTVYNAAGQFRQFWDGRAADVEEQVLGPLFGEVEMAAPSADYVLDVLRSMPEYREAFAAAYPHSPQPISLSHVADAIGAFERGLVTPSRWDRYLNGDPTALTADELRGFKIFNNAGCVTCHTGPLVGGVMYAKVGLEVPWPNLEDHGRYETTQRDGDDFAFKVPSLRNVAETAPYFHDGSVATLHEAIQAMAVHQLGGPLSEQDVDAIAVWLRTLTGSADPSYIAKPKLPPSTAATPDSVP